MQADTKGPLAPDQVHAEAPQTGPEPTTTSVPDTAASQGLPKVPEAPKGPEVPQEPEVPANGSTHGSKKDVKLRNRSTKQIAATASTSVRRGTRMLLIHTVPEEARNYMEDHSAMLTGLSAIFALLAALCVLIWFYSRCTTTTVLVSQPSKHHSECVQQLTINNRDTNLDRQGVWAADPSYRPAEAIWRVTFANGYQANETRFRSDMEQLFTTMNTQLDRQQGRRWYEVLQALTYLNITVNGTQGYLRLRPNLDFGQMLSNKVTDWSQARNMTNFVKIPPGLFEGNASVNGLPRTPEVLGAMALGRELKNCSGVIIPHGYNFLQVRGRRAFSVIDREKQFPVNYTRYDPIPGGCRKTQVALPAQDGDRDVGVPLIEEIVNYPGRQDTFDIQWDVPQVFSIDWCNRNWDRCIASYCPSAAAAAPLATAYTPEFASCARARLLLLGSTERYPTTYSPKIRRLGFFWNATGAERADRAVGVRTYLVVPELLPDYSCVSCGAGAEPGIDCQTFLGVELHYYSYDPANDAATTYYTTFEYSIQLDGSINADMARPSVHCTTADLRLAKTPSELAKSLAVPFDLDKGVQQCKLEICKSPLELLSLSFSNVVLLYTCFCVLTVLVVMYTNGRKAEQARQAKKLQLTGVQFVGGHDDMATFRKEQEHPQQRLVEAV